MKSIIVCIFLFINVLHAQHYKKDGSPDRRYKESRTSSYRSTYTYHPKRTYTKKSNFYSSNRDDHGKIRRSSKARYQFMKQSGYRKGRKGYVVDHIVPLKKGGCDCPSNMQWQTKEEAKLKDKWE